MATNSCVWMWCAREPWQPSHCIQCYFRFNELQLFPHKELVTGVTVHCADCQSVLSAVAARSAIWNFLCTFNLFVFSLIFPFSLFIASPPSRIEPTHEKSAQAHAISAHSCAEAITNIVIWSSQQHRLIAPSTCCTIYTIISLIYRAGTYSSSFCWAIWFIT